MLEMTGRKGFLLAADVGASKTRVCLADGSGRILEKRSATTPKGGSPDSLPKIILELGGRLLERYGGIKVADVISIASIGPLDIKKGLIVGSPNIPFKQVPVRDFIAQHYDGSIVLLNDCNAAVLAEKMFGAAADKQNLVYITISSGIGGGAIVDGQLLLGKDGNAAEVGHIVVNFEGNLICGCGKTGHWEGYCSGTGLPRFALWLIMNKYATIQSKLAASASRNESWVTAEKVFESAREEDPLASMILRDFTEINLAGLGSVINVYDPEAIFLGGSVTLNNIDLVVGPLRNEIEKFAINRIPEIGVTSLGHDAPLLGALAAAIDPPERSIVT